MSQKWLAVAALGRDRYEQVNYIGKTQGCHGPVAVSTGDRYGEVTAKAGSTVLRNSIRGIHVNRLIKKFLKKEMNP